MEHIHDLLQKLENEIKTQNFIRLYGSIREKHSFIQPYPAPESLIAVLHNRQNPDYAHNDRILSALIAEYQDTGAFGSYLVLLFRPGLMKLYFLFQTRAKVFASLSHSDLLSLIIEMFFEELSFLDLSKTKAKVASVILGRLRNRLRDTFRGLFKTLQAEAELRNNPEACLEPCSAPDPEETSQLIDQLAQAGVISDIDKRILIDTSVNKKSFKDLEKDFPSLSSAALRQRKSRAQRAILSYLKRNKNFMSQNQSPLTYTQ